MPRDTTMAASQVYVHPTAVSKQAELRRNFLRKRNADVSLLSEQRKLSKENWR